MTSRPEVTEEMLKGMLDLPDVAIYTFDKDRKVLCANRAAKAMLQNAEAGRAMGAAEENHFTHNQYFDEKGDRLPYPHDSAVERALRGESTRNLLLEHRDLKQHTQRWIRISCTPILDESGAFSYGIVSYQDVTAEKKRADRLRFLVEAAKVLYLTADYKSRLQAKAKLAVPTLADWCSIDVKGSDGKVESIARVHSDPERVAFSEEFDRGAAHSYETRSERVIRTGKAEFLPLITPEYIDKIEDMPPMHKQYMKELNLTSLMVIPIVASENILGTFTAAFAESGRVYAADDLEFFTEFCNHLGVVLENTRLYNEIQERDTAKDAFLASLSHELRNPLAPIKSALELLRLKDSDLSDAEELETIEHQFDHMTRLLTDLLDVTRFKRGKIKLNIEELELTEIVRQVATAVFPIAENAGVSLSIYNRAESLIILHADRTRVEQALSNLLHNAIKFTQRGDAIRVEVGLEGRQARVVVSDTGIGISESEAAHIFEPYYQSERIKPGANRGLGIGLPLVYEIARLHGGSIEVASDGPGKGSTFTLRLPLTAPATATSPAHSAALGQK